MYKKLFVFLFVVLTPLFASAEIVAPKIVVVDIKRIMKESSAALDANSQLEKKRKEYQSQITSEENKLKQAEEDLVKQKNILSKEAMSKKQKEFIDKINNVRSDVQKKKINLDNAYKNALNDIQSSVVSIIEELSEEQGFNMAVPTSQLIYADKDMDISAEVLKRLNKKLPKAKIKFN